MKPEQLTKKQRWTFPI